MLFLAKLLFIVTYTATFPCSGCSFRDSSNVQSLKEMNASLDKSWDDIDLYDCPSIKRYSLNGDCGTTSANFSTGSPPDLGSGIKYVPQSNVNRSNLPTPGSTSLEDCLTKIGVPVTFPNSADFLALARPYNLRLAYTPVAVVLPRTVTHISKAVICAVENKVRVQAKSGGHSYASFSSGGQDGSMIIDLKSGSQDVVVYANGNTRVEAGVQIGNLAFAIFNQDRRALAHGIYLGVGIGGHASHGGFGYSSRAWGLTLDAIIALEVVLANGTFINATSTAYLDIFFALEPAEYWELR